MFIHLLKLIWNKKKQNLVLMSELFISFLIMFAVFSLVVFYYFNYRKPMGFAYDRVWTISYNTPEHQKALTADSLLLIRNTLKNVILSNPGVEDVTFTSNNLPFSFNTSNSIVNYEKNDAQAHIYNAEDNYSRILELNVTNGRWFTKADDGLKDRVAVINHSLAEKLFGVRDAIGKIVSLGDSKFEIVGVVEDFKDKGDYVDPEYQFFKKRHSSELEWDNAILLKVKSGAGAKVESKLHKSLGNALNVSNIEIEHLDAKRIRKNNVTLVPMIILLVVAGFLIINVALGLFGVLWYNINKRRGEIGLRRAVGASGHSISFQLVSEALVISTLSLVLGTFFAVQFPLLHVFDLPSSVYLTAISLSVIFIYLLVVLCAIYPGKQAAGIYPAVALHEE